MCDFLTMHGYPIYAAWSDGPTDERLVPFLARVTRWLGGGADVMFSEFGLPTAPRGEPALPPFVAEDDAARYTGRVLDGVRLAGCTGAMLWCYGDYDPRMWNFPPLDEAVHERSFGLWRADGSAKPAVGVVGAFAGTTCSPPPDDGWIDIDAGRYWQRPGVELSAPVRPLQGDADRLGLTTRPSRPGRDILEQLEARGAFRALAATRQLLRGSERPADRDPVPTERRAERRERIRVHPDDVVDGDVVDAGEVVRLAQEVLRRLHVDGATAATAEMLQVDPAVQVLGGDPDARGGLDPPEVEPVRERDHVAGEPIAADVRRLPRLLRVGP